MFDNDQLSKIRMIIEHFNKTMLDLVTPKKNLSIDGSMMLWRGRLMSEYTSKIEAITNKNNQK